MPELIIPDLTRIDEAARTFLEPFEDPVLVAFSGDMGAGKTTFIQALCRALGVRVEVSSPTFALVNEYESSDRRPIYHFDLYRIEDPAELFDLGYEEYFYSGHWCFIEWPEKAEHLIPESAIRVRVEPLETGGRILRY
ncbi:MAG: tRNA (adenosine(37)-N6)-threonylcarbamoyltransferase complex ATPase subunit type 1 TsaE [Bacteroidales bacterium]